MHKLALCLFVVLFAACQELPVPDTVVLPETPTQHTVYADGHPLALWEKSHPNPSKAILLLHGRTWSGLPDFDLQVPGEERSLMDGLVERGYAVYALDMRGYGSTPRDSTGWLAPNRAAADVATVLEWMAQQAPEAEKPILFGWSLGSMVSQLVAQQRPELMSALILFGYPIDPDQEIPMVDDPDEPARQENTAEAAASDFITEGSISQAALDVYVQVALEADPVRVDWYRMHEFDALDPAEVTVPTLLMQGEFDPFAPTDTQARFFSRLGTSDRQWVVISGGDHAALLENARPWFLHAMTAFIEWPYGMDAVQNER